MMPDTDHLSELEHDAHGLLALQSDDDVQWHRKLRDDLIGSMNVGADLHAIPPTQQRPAAAVRAGSLLLLIIVGGIAAVWTFLLLG